jgi:hypothetical protein
MAAPTRILEILRDFLEVHRLVRGLAEQHRAEGLLFGDLAALIRDDESSVLFRLKERTHAKFRAGPGARKPTHREALFDLAIGSLFHEAMKLRENVYQREIYGPRVRALHTEAGEESKALFDEFEKMLGSVNERLDEGIRELETLVRQTAEQLRLLVGEAPEDGAARFLSEKAAEVEVVFGVSLETLLEEIYGSVALGLERAGHSYVASGYFAEAADRLERAMAEPGADPRTRDLCEYARGLHAYVERDYARSVQRLETWISSGTPESELVPLARDALTSIANLAEGAEDGRVSREARELLFRLGGGKASPPTPISES